jgi:hypothetical protein
MSGQRGRTGLQVQVVASVRRVCLFCSAQDLYNTIHTFAALLLGPLWKDKH